MIRNAWNKYDKQSYIGKEKCPTTGHVTTHYGHW